MGWAQPKTNWTLLDYFNLEDWNRIKNNLDVLNELLDSQHMISTPLLDLTLNKGTLSIPYVTDVNNLEENLKRIYEILGFSIYETTPTKVWYSRLSNLYASNPTSDDWNRWEELILRIRYSLDYMSSYENQRVLGTFYAGTLGVQIQRFSRGR